MGECGCVLQLLHGLLGSGLLFIQLNIVRSCSLNLPQTSWCKILMHSISINVVFRCTNEGIQVCCLGRIHHTCLVKKNNCSYSSMMSAQHSYTEVVYLEMACLWVQVYP